MSQRERERVKSPRLGFSCSYGTDKTCRRNLVWPGLVSCPLSQVSLGSSIMMGDCIAYCSLANILTSVFS